MIYQYLTSLFIYDIFLKLITFTITLITTIFFLNIMRLRCPVSLIQNIKPPFQMALEMSQGWNCVDFVFAGLCEQCPMAMMFGHMHPVSLSNLSFISCPTGSAVHMLPHTWSQSWDHMALMMVCCNRIHSLLTHN